MLPTKVLIVEDEKIIAMGIEMQLEEMGYVVAGSVSTGEEAVRAAVEIRPDLIIMDIGLGGVIDGIQAAELICQQIDVPVVYLTANADPATLQRAKLTGPYGYLLKPYEEKDLQTAIEIGLYRHKIELRLRENEQWLAATLGSIGDGLIATDERGRVRFMNLLAEQMTGWTQADALKRDVRDVFRIIDEKTRQSMTNPAIDALQKGESVPSVPDAMLTHQCASERPIDVSASPIRSVNGKLDGAVLVFRDTTERRRLEDQLRQAQKMEAIGRLAGGIAHDFNNIITIIVGVSEVLVRHPQLPSELIHFAQDISDAGMSAATLVKQIMAFSRKQMLRPCVLNLNIVLQEMGEMVQRLIGEHIEIVTCLATDLGSVKADPTQIKQVILNLAANARDAMPLSGRLVIATENTELGESTTREHPDVKPGRYASLSICDTGIGIVDEVLPHIFEPFFTTKGDGEGTGLGLASVYGVVKQSGGHIEVMSKIGEGTTFRVYLPLVDEPTPPAERLSPRAANGHETFCVSKSS